MRLQSSHVFSNVETRRFRRARSARRPRFNRATFFQTWKPESPIPIWLWLLSFNRATFFQTWKPAACPNCGRPLIRLASIEPRFFKRGNLALNATANFGANRFNRATFFQTWKHFADCFRDRRVFLCFNRATFFQTWKRWRHTCWQA